jgi:hypothetical protein
MSNHEDNIDEIEILEENKKSYKKKQIEEWSEQDVQNFLISNEFKEKDVNQLKDFNGKKLKGLSKEDCKEILGNANGIALFNCITNFEKGKLFFIKIFKVSCSFTIRSKSILYFISLKGKSLS